MQDGNVQDEPESKELLKKEPHIIGVEKGTSEPTESAPSGPNWNN